MLRPLPGTDGFKGDIILESETVQGDPQMVLRLEFEVTWLYSTLKTSTSPSSSRIFPCPGPIILSGDMDECVKPTLVEASKQ